MPLSADNAPDVAKAIQLSLAPVFLLMGVTSMLGVMTGRLARIIDRGRTLTEHRRDTASPAQYASELANLERRRHFVSAAITACTIAALLICMVIVVLFVDVMLAAPLQWLIAGLFIGATIALVIAWGYFLREVHLATTLTRLNPPKGD